MTTVLYCFLSFAAGASAVALALHVRTFVAWLRAKRSGITLSVKTTIQITCDTDLPLGKYAVDDSYRVVRSESGDLYATHAYQTPEATGKFEVLPHASTVVVPIEDAGLSITEEPATWG